MTAVAQRRLAALARQLEQIGAGQESGADRAELSLLAPEREPAEPGAALSAQAPGRHARVPPPRWRLTAHQVAAIALLALVAVLVAAWWVVRAMPAAEPVQLSSERRIVPTAAATDSGAPPASTPTGGAPDPTAAPPVVVDVTGKVRSPGIVELPAGSRVVDALRAADGAVRGVETSSLNLARPLVDGEQIVVGTQLPVGGVPPPVPSVPGVSTAALAPVDLNLATQPELEAIPGVGPVTATAILTWRAEHGGFSSVEELLEVSGIGDATLAEIAPFVYV